MKYENVVIVIYTHFKTMRSRKRKKYLSREKVIVGFGLFRREQYQLLLESAADRDNLDDTYDEWLRSFREGVKNARSTGIEPVKVDVDMEELLSYCKKHNLKNNAETRSQFYAELLREGRWEEID